MLKILCLIKDKKRLDALVPKLVSMSLFSVRGITSPKEIVPIFVSDGPFSVIIADFITGKDGQTTVCTLLKRAFPATPIVCLSDKSSPRIGADYVVAKTAPFDELKNILKDLFVKNIEIKKHDHSEEFRAIASKMFLKFNEVECDVYLKLSNKKYIKIIVTPHTL